MKLPIHEHMESIFALGVESTSNRKPDRKLIRQANIKKVDVQQIDKSSGLQWIAAVFFGEPIVVALKPNGIVVEATVQKNKLVITELKQEYLNRLEIL